MIFTLLPLACCLLGIYLLFDVEGTNMALCDDPERRRIGNLELDLSDGTVWSIQDHREDCKHDDSCDCDRESTFVGQFSPDDWDADPTPQVELSPAQNNDYYTLGGIYQVHFATHVEVEHPSLTAMERNR